MTPLSGSTSSRLVSESAAHSTTNQRMEAAVASSDESEDPLALLDGVKFAFGLRAQGHLPVIERMLARGATWPEIGDAIGWCPDTAREWFERERAADAARYSVEHGQSPQAQAARVLRDFMCCQAGRDLVEHGLLRPFGYTLDPGPVVAENRELRDRVQRLELRLEDERP